MLLAKIDWLSVILGPWSLEYIQLEAFAGRMLLVFLGT